MQVAKAGTRKVLIKTARESFLEKGFNAVSMREISEKSGVGLSNIYNYFRNKDDLLATVLQPFIKAFDKMMEEHNSEENTTVEIFTSEEFQRESIRNFVSLIVKFRKEIKLLFFSSAGSSFENYRDRLIDRNTQTGLQYVELMRGRYPNINTEISPFFIHTTCTWWVGVLEQIAQHDELTDAEIEQFIGEYVRFGTAGWKALMRV